MTKTPFVNPSLARCRDSALAVSHPPPGHSGEGRLPRAMESRRPAASPSPTRRPQCRAAAQGKDQLPWLDCFGLRAKEGSGKGEGEGEFIFCEGGEARCCLGSSF
eukprot:TRINITY_DN19338_c0_g2_i1.p3 TRINITY_DN19338_c0_g2~~TRINITY_DN19338_c0_g2_i1.p3  ORF type:complete len:105 (-),score=16.93 TRINITY_DN19338_c0_g2_i1:200-514(-)